MKSFPSVPRLAMTWIVECHPSAFGTKGKQGAPDDVAPEEKADDGWPENPLRVGEEVEDDERARVVLAAHAPAAEVCKSGQQHVRVLERVK